MSISATNNRNDYIGNGATIVYSYTFKLTSEEHLFVYVQDLDGDIFLMTNGVHYTVNTPLAGETGTINLLSSVYTEIGGELIDGYGLLLIRILPVDNEDTFRNMSRFYPERHDHAFDYRTMIDQQITEAIGRAIKMGVMQKISDFNPNFPAGEIPPDHILIVKADGTGFEWISKADMIGPPGEGGVPPGGDEFALLEKASPTDSDTRWTDPLVYQGYSERFAEIVDLEGAKATIDYIMDMGYAPPNVNLSSNVANTLREIGDAITSMTLTAAIVKVLNDIDEVRFYIGATLLDTQNSGGGIPAGGNSTYPWTGNFSTNTTFSVQVDDTSLQAKPSRTATLTYSFVRPYFHGAGVDGLTAAQVATLTKSIKNSTNNEVRTFVATAGQYLYFAQPSSYAAITQIFDQNNFDVTASWTSFTGNYTALDGSSQTLRVYKLVNPVAAGSYDFRFTR